MRGLALPRGDWPLIAGGALLVFFAYPPFHLLLPSFLALIPAVWLIEDAQADPRPLRRRLVQGFWFGLGAHGLVLYWIVVALWHFTPAVAAGYFATILILAGYAAVTFALTGWVVRRTGVSIIVVFPVFWVAAEWLIGHQGDIRFPWLGLGTSLTGYSTLVQVADLIGARGVTFALVAANAALALAWRRRGERRRAAVLAGGVAAGVLAALVYGIVRERTLPVRPVGEVAVIQPNVGFDEKWEGETRDSIMQRTLTLAARAIRETRADLVVWPEAAVPGYFLQHPEWARAIARLSFSTRTPQLVGGLDVAFPAPRRFEYYNAAFLFDSLGDRTRYEAYHKQYLVPITERVPFVNPRWFKLRFFGGFGEGGPGPVYQVGIGRFGVLICYESIFENLSRDYRRRGAEFLINITNDAWFGRSTAPYQHEAHLVMRAIETRAGIARSANTGISEFVDPLGRQHRQTALFVEALVAHRLTTTDVVTLYVRWGDWVGGLALVGAVLLAIYAWRRRP